MSQMEAATLQHAQAPGQPQPGPIVKKSKPNGHATKRARSAGYSRASYELHREQIIARRKERRQEAALQRLGEQKQPRRAMVSLKQRSAVGGVQKRRRGAPEKSARKVRRDGKEIVDQLASMEPNTMGSVINYVVDHPRTAAGVAAAGLATSLRLDLLAQAALAHS